MGGDLRQDAVAEPQGLQLSSGRVQSHVVGGKEREEHMGVAVAHAVPPVLWSAGSGVSHHGGPGRRPFHELLGQRTSEDVGSPRAASPLKLKRDVEAVLGLGHPGSSRGDRQPPGLVGSDEGADEGPGGARLLDTQHHD